MNHQPFEEWLLSDESLSPAEEKALQAHLETCKECAPLGMAWQEARAEIRRMPAVSPAHGFTQRWEARMEAERIRKQRRLTWFLLILTGAGTLALALVGIYQHFGGFPSPIRLLAGLMFAFTSSMEQIKDIGNFCLAIFQSMPLVIPVALWILMSTSVFLWIAIWVFSIWRLPFSKRSNPS